MARSPTKALAYYRTSSAANVGNDKDSQERQRRAVAAYARSAKLNVVEEFYDPAVSGDDAIEARPGFSAMLDRIEGNGVSTVIVEGADRLARSVVAQELGVMVLIERGVRVLTASGQDLTETDDPAKVAMRQMAAVFSQFEKARLVAKLRAARDRKRTETGRCEGRKPPSPELVREAKRLARRNPRTGKKRSLRGISRELAALGHTGPTGNPYSAEGVRKLLARAAA
jgi:DNA invertase Pin-like site-specific DNA recombinase